MSKMHFPLFQNHIDFAHLFWKNFLEQRSSMGLKSIVVDATMGNGHDTLFLASNMSLSHTESRLFALDINKNAVRITHNRLITNELEKMISSEKITLLTMCHSLIDQIPLIQPIHLTVYNLGYLPGDLHKNETTKQETTLLSIEKSIALTAPGGVISITCYPGHEEGEQELSIILQAIENKKLPVDNWNTSCHLWKNRPKTPVLILLQKAELQESDTAQ